LIEELSESSRASCFDKDLQIQRNPTELTIVMHNNRISLAEVIKFCPRRLDDNRLVLFLLFQITDAVLQLHQAGLPHFGLTLGNVFVDHTHSCVLGVPDFTSLHQSGFYSKTVKKKMQQSQKYSENSNCPELANMTLKWVLRQCSNYDYLMYLNQLAGRTKGDPINSAILPWVTDFTQPHAGLRDLTKSKYHLTKGEAQLDANYQAFVHEHSRVTNALHGIKPMGLPINRTLNYEDHVNELMKDLVNVSPDRITVDEELRARQCTKKAHLVGRGVAGRFPDTFQPHHLLDVMPNLAYYTYMARRTPKEVLTRYVRPVYQPNEFPPNMARLYELTPEECIPEFFTDPSVFTSIHADMPDLSLPGWCDTPEQFVAYHLSVLESDAVSSMLHNWIDLTFGYKLIGEAAIQAKNVHLELAGTPHILRRTGITCLFRTPHPSRWVPSLCSGRYFGPCFPELGSRLSASVQPTPVTTEEANCTRTVHNSSHSSKPNNPDRDPSKQKVSLEIESSNSSVSLNLPSDYDPLALIRTYDGLCRFLATETRHPDGFDLPPMPVLTPDCVHLSELFAHDVESIACLVVELFTHSVINYTEADRWTHAYRVSHAYRTFQLHRDLVPRCLHRGLDYILNCDSNSVKAVSAFRPSAEHLLHLLFEFPPYFYDLRDSALWVRDQFHIFD
uniref:BEACH domain-containing protein n=1 Tax=Echinostoma caproni TaxID=27848 RepID=A0A183AWH8_9TREM